MNWKAFGWSLLGLFLAWGGGFAVGSNVILRHAREDPDLLWELVDYADPMSVWTVLGHTGISLLGAAMLLYAGRMSRGKRREVELDCIDCWCPCHWKGGA